MFLWMLLANSLPFINADNTDEGISIQNISIYWTVSAAMSGYVRQSLQLCQTMSDKLYSLSFIWWNVWWPRIFFHRFTLFSQFHQQHRQHWQSDILWRWTLSWVGLTNVFLESMVPFCSQMFLFDFSSQETAQIMDANGTTGAGFKTFVWKLTLLQLWSSGALTSPRRWTLPTSEQRSTFPRARSQDFADTGQVVSKIVATVSDSRPIQKNRPQGPIPLTWVGFTMISIVFYLLTMVASISFNPFDSRFCSWSCQHFWFNCGVGKGVRCSFPKCASRFVSLGSVERFAWWTKGLSSNSSNQLPWLLEETS